MSFINAIRGIDSNTAASANVDDCFANITHGVLPGSLNFEKYGYPINAKPVIYFYDTGGFGDAVNKKYNLEENLKKYQEDINIKFYAIICVFDTTRFKKEEIELLEDQENKVCLVLYYFGHS